MNKRLQNLVNALNLKRREPTGNRDYATPPSAYYDFQRKSGKTYLILAVPLESTEYVESASGNSLIVGAFNVPPTTVKVGGEVVDVGVSRGRVWLKPHSPSRGGGRGLPF